MQTAYTGVAKIESQNWNSYWMNTIQTFTTHIWHLYLVSFFFLVENSQLNNENGTIWWIFRNQFETSNWNCKHFLIRKYFRMQKYRERKAHLNCIVYFNDMSRKLKRSLLMLTLHVIMNRSKTSEYCRHCRDNKWKKITDIRWNQRCLNVHFHVCCMHTHLSTLAVFWFLRHEWNAFVSFNHTCDSSCFTNCNVLLLFSY